MHLILLSSILCVVTADTVITTSNGPVKSVNGLVEDVDAFLGIPYAEPPIGERRFAKPVPKTEWNEIYEASTIPPPCAQVWSQPYYFMPDLSNMSEDCLYLNIWTPKSTSSNGLRPIIIFLHSGLYMYGSASLKQHDGSKLASRGDIIVASVNYRLGAFGFFWGFTEDASGSAGVYDQIMAINWIKDNAKHFGGDPENIVIMGSSVGAYSTASFILSPLTKNLFKKAIIQSGGVLSPVFEDNNARLIESSRHLASVAGCTNASVALANNSDVVVQCLRRKPVEAIIEAQEIILKSSPVLFVPRVNDALLPKSPINLVREGKFRKYISVLTGYTKDEGTVLLTYSIPEYFGFYGRDSVKITSEKRALTFARGAMVSAKVSNFTEIGNLYIEKVRNGTSDEFTKMVANVIGDYVVTCPTVFMANFLSLADVPVYFYKFAFRAASTPLAEWMGTTHLDEIQYVFGNPYHENFTSEETELSHHLMDRWSAFAWTGNPNIPDHLSWPRYSYQNGLYLNFGQTGESIQARPSETCEFWKKRFQAEIDEPLTQFFQNSFQN